MRIGNPNKSNTSSLSLTELLENDLRNRLNTKAKALTQTNPRRMQETMTQKPNGYSADLMGNTLSQETLYVPSQCSQMPTLDVSYNPQSQGRQQVECNTNYQTQSMYSHTTNLPQQLSLQQSDALTSFYANIGSEIASNVEQQMSSLMETERRRTCDTIRDIVEKCTEKLDKHERQEYERFIEIQREIERLSCKMTEQLKDSGIRAENMNMEFSKLFQFIDKKVYKKLIKRCETKSKENYCSHPCQQPLRKNLPLFDVRTAEMEKSSNDLALILGGSAVSGECNKSTHGKKLENEDFDVTAKDPRAANLSVVSHSDTVEDVSMFCTTIGFSEEDESNVQKVLTPETIDARTKIPITPCHKELWNIEENKRNGNIISSLRRRKATDRLCLNRRNLKYQSCEESEDQYDIQTYLSSNEYQQKSTKRLKKAMPDYGEALAYSIIEKAKMKAMNK